MGQQTNLTTQLDLGGRAVTLRVKHNPRARRMILKIDHTSGEVHVTAPTKKSMKDAPGFVRREEHWVTSKLDALPTRVPFTPGTTLPLRGVPTTICHCPDGKRGTWHDREAATLQVSGDAEFIARRMNDWLRREARRDLSESVADLTRQMELPLPKITVRDTHSRWGSCSSSGTLSFSWRLILAPPSILAYVAAHEVAHLKHLNHSKTFWALLESLDPEYREAESWMKANAVELFRFG